jgi:hypothetical protein
VNNKLPGNECNKPDITLENRPAKNWITRKVSRLPEPAIGAFSNIVLWKKQAL